MPHSVDARLSAAVRLAERTLGVKVFCLIHQPSGPYDIDTISPWLHDMLLAQLKRHPRGEPVAVLLHSPGGDAHSAYRMAKSLIRHCGEYYVIIPRYAKSAATLFTLGASRIYFGEHAEIGPIDVQVNDPERERQISALEMVQSLERLNSEAMQVMDAMMSLLLNRSGKRIDSLLPSVLKYAADVTRPIFDKVDTVSFTYHARLLKIGEDYAKLLLQEQYPPHQAETIAASLTRGYPDHGFAIDKEETGAIGLELEDIPDILREPLGPFSPSYTKSTVIGFLEDVANATKDAKPANAPPDKPKATNAAVPTANGQSPHRNGRQRRASYRIGQSGPS